MTEDTYPDILAEQGVIVPRMGRHSHDGTYFKFIFFPTPAGLSEEHIIPNELISDTRQLHVYLVRHGMRMPADKTEKAKLIDAIQQYEPPELCTLTSRTGWHDCSYVQPHATYSPEGADDIVYVGDQGSLIKPTSGTLEEWQDEIAQPLTASTFGVLLVCIALAPILIKFVKLENGMFHISGKSGVGKTTFLRVAASVWLGGQRSVASWDITPIAFQEFMARKNDSIGLFDEFSSTSADKRTQSKIMYDVAYMVGSGIPRRRSKHFKGSAADVETYRVLALSTGEKSAAEIAEAAGEKRLMGEEARILDLPILDCATGIFDRLSEAGYDNARSEATKLADHLNEATGRYYGTASKAFIRYVVGHLEHVEQEVPRLVELFNHKLKVPATGWERRISSKFGLAYAAGRLAIEAGVLPYSEKLIRDCCVSPYLLARSQLTTAEDLNRAALEKLQVMVKNAVVVGSAKRPAPSIESVDSAPALCVMKDGKTVHILVEVSAFKTIGDRAVREALVSVLDEAGIFIKPDRHPREKSIQKIVIKGAKRGRYLCFTKRLIKFRLPD